MPRALQLVNELLLPDLVTLALSHDHLASATEPELSVRTTEFSATTERQPLTNSIRDNECRSTQLLRRLL